MQLCQKRRVRERSWGMNCQNKRAFDGCCVWLQNKYGELKRKKKAVLCLYNLSIAECLQVQMCLWAPLQDGATETSFGQHLWQFRTKIDSPGNLNSTSWLCHIFLFNVNDDERLFFPCRCCTSGSCALFSWLACCRTSAQLRDFGSFCFCNTTSVALSLYKSRVVARNLPCIVGLRAT